MPRSGASLTTKVVYSLVLAVVVYLGLSIYAGWGELRSALSDFNWEWFPLVLLLVLGNYLIRFLKWQYYLKLLGIKVPRRDSLLIHFSGLALSITPGKVGEVVKSYLLKKGFNHPLTRTAPIVLADRLTDLLACIILTAVGAIGFQYGQQVIWTVTGVIVVIIAVVTYRPAGEKLIGLLGSVPGLRRREASIRQLYESSYELLRPVQLIWPLTVSVIAWTCEAVAFFLIFQGLGIATPFLGAMFIYAFSSVVGAVAMLPGGLGAMEGSLTALLRVVSVPEAVAAAATVLIRVATLWFAVLIGSMALLRAERRFDISVKELD